MISTSSAIVAETDAIPCRVTGLDMLSLSRRFIVAPMTAEPGAPLSVFSIFNVPALPFDAWLTEQLQRLHRRDAAFEALYRSIARTRWSLYEKWWLLNEVLDRGVLLPIYESLQSAVVALKIMQCWESEART